MNHTPSHNEPFACQNNLPTLANCICCGSGIDISPRIIHDHPTRLRFNNHVAKAVVGVHTNFFEGLGIFGEDILSARASENPESVTLILPADRDQTQSIKTALQISIRIGSLFYLYTIHGSAS